MAVHSVAAGAPIYASDINALVTALTPATTTTNATVGVVASGFSITDVRAATYSDGRLITVDLYIARTGADISASGGNIPDTVMFTLAAAYRPVHTVAALWSNGVVSGEAAIASDGTVLLRTAGGNITGTAGTGITNIRLSTAYSLG